jgi:hypothetical protein
VKRAAALDDLVSQFVDPENEASLSLEPLTMQTKPSPAASVKPPSQQQQTKSTAPSDDDFGDFEFHSAPAEGLVEVTSMIRRYENVGLTCNLFYLS